MYISDIYELTFADISKVEYFEIETAGEYFENSYFKEEDYSTEEKFNKLFDGNAGDVIIVARLKSLRLIIYKEQVTFKNKDTVVDNAKQYLKELLGLSR